MRKLFFYVERIDVIAMCTPVVLLLDPTDQFAQVYSIDNFLSPQDCTSRKHTMLGTHTMIISHIMCYTCTYCNGTVYAATGS